MEDCIFCKIVSGTIPSDVVYEDDRFIAIRDIHPQAPVHVLILPRLHWPDLLAFAADPGGAETARALPAAIAGVARACGVDGNGFRLVANHGRDGGQSVSHVHFHLLGGVFLGERIH